MPRWLENKRVCSAHGSKMSLSGNANEKTHRQHLQQQLTVPHQPTAFTHTVYYYMVLYIYMYTYTDGLGDFEPSRQSKLRHHSNSNALDSRNAYGSARA